LACRLFPVAEHLCLPAKTSFATSGSSGERALLLALPPGDVADDGCEDREGRVCALRSSLIWPWLAAMKLERSST
jgi:hypothetical protein